MSHKLEHKYIIRGKIRVETGLMIGGTSSGLEIGGTDKQIVRHPVTKEPYIPGSSLKGKMRSLYELSRGQINATDRSFGPTQNPQHTAARLFGHVKDRQNKRESQQPSRLIVRDSNMTKASKERLRDTELPYSEIKAENSIDRITAVANPRFFERVPQGAEFELSMVLNVMRDDKGHTEDFLPEVWSAMQLLQDDYLGGSGSRGNGQISFKVESVRRKSYGEDGSVQESEVEITTFRAYSF
jgi:CRISPR-associated protein Csm3